MYLISSYFDDVTIFKMQQYIEGVKTYDKGFRPVNHK